MTIGQRICKRRQELGMTQEELAFKMGYKTRNAIYQYEKSENMKLSLIEKFASALNCTETYLLGWDEEEEKRTEERYLIDSYWELDEESRRQIVLMLAFFKDQQNKKDGNK